MILRSDAAQLMSERMALHQRNFRGEQQQENRGVALTRARSSRRVPEVPYSVLRCRGPRTDCTCERTIGTEPGTDLVALDDALRALADVDGRKSQVVELRFFGGLSVDETAAALNVSAGTVMRDWRLAKAWLLKQLDQGS
jgi:DNA-directed RNA polymerase specialized sigma24 family protein